MEKRQTENFQVLIDEARSEQKSVRWRAANADLKRIHQDLPDVASNTAKYLAGLGPAMAPRLANTSIREVGAFETEQLTDSQFMMAVRRTHRSVLMQESADHLLKEKFGVQAAGDFMSLRKAVTNPSYKAGSVAVSALEKQGIDAVTLLGKMDVKSLRATAVGAYDRVDDKHRDALINALETYLPGNQQETERLSKIESLPVMRNPRTQFASKQRQPTFGRRIAQEFAADEQAIRDFMTAGQGL